MTPDTLRFGMEVDVARSRPPTPATVVTHGVVIAVADRPSLACAENEARTLAALMCHHRGEMVTAVRIAWAVL